MFLLLLLLLLLHNLLYLLSFKIAHWNIVFRNTFSLHLKSTNRKKCILYKRWKSKKRVKDWDYTHYRCSAIGILIFFCTFFFFYFNFTSSVCVVKKMPFHCNIDIAQSIRFFVSGFCAWQMQKHWIKSTNPKVFKPRMKSRKIFTWKPHNNEKKEGNKRYFNINLLLLCAICAIIQHQQPNWNEWKASECARVHFAFFFIATDLIRFVRFVHGALA